MKALPITPTQGPRFANTLVVLISLFFMWGFLTCMNDILIPQLRIHFKLSYGSVMWTQFCFFIAYFIGSVPFGRLVSRAGYKVGIITGLGIGSLGALLFYFAAYWQSFQVFLSAFFILALGLTLLQVAANPYAAILGPEATAHSRLNLMAAFNSLGTTVAPIVGSWFILKPDQSLAQGSGGTHAIQGVYLFIAITLFVMASGILFWRFPTIPSHTAMKVMPDAEEGLSTPMLGQSFSIPPIWKHRHLLLGTLGIFAYVGSEVSIGSFLISFLSDPSVAGIPLATAARYVSFYWGGAMIGRFIGSWILTRVNPPRLLAIHSAMAASLLLLAMHSTGAVATVAVLSIGLFNSIMFPTIFSLGLKNLGKLTAQGSGILCMAIVGGAIVPLLQGVLADQIGIQNAFIVPFFCYLYVLFYAMVGHQVREVAIPSKGKS